MRPSRLFLAIAIASLLFSGRLHAGVSIPIQFRDGMIWLKVSVPGKSEPLNFLLDSGAGASVIDITSAQRLGLHFGARQSVQGVHCRGYAYPVNTFPAHVSGTPIPSSLLAMDLSAPSAGLHQRIDGLLGADFFRDRIVQIDFAAQTVRLLGREELNSIGCEILPLVKRNDSLCTRVSVDGNEPEWLRLDTGCNTALEWVVTGNRAKKLGLTTIGLNSASVRELHTDVRFGATRIAAVKTGIHTEQMFTGEAGLVGNGLLSHFVVTIDATKQRCILANR